MLAIIIILCTIFYLKKFESFYVIKIGLIKDISYEPFYIDLLIFLLALVVFIKILVLYKNELLSLKIIDKVYTTLINISIGSIGVKMVISEIKESDVVINRSFLKIFRKYSEEEYIEKGKELLGENKILDKFGLNVEDIYKTLNPQEMGIWKKEFVKYIMDLEENYRLMEMAKLQDIINAKLNRSWDLLGISGGKYILAALTVVGLGIGIYALSNYLVNSLLAQHKINDELIKEINKSKESDRAIKEFIANMNNYIYGGKVERLKGDGTKVIADFKGIEKIISDHTKMIVSLKLEDVKLTKFLDMYNRSLVENLKLIYTNLDSTMGLLCAVSIFVARNVTIKDPADVKILQEEEFKEEDLAILVANLKSLYKQRMDLLKSNFDINDNVESNVNTTTSSSYEDVE